MEFNFEKFYANISEIGGVYRITIPKKLIDGTGWQTGDKIKVLAVKVEEPEE